MIYHNQLTQQNTTKRKLYFSSKETYVNLTAILLITLSSIINIFNSSIRFFIERTYRIDTLIIYLIIFSLIIKSFERIVNRSFNITTYLLPLIFLIYLIYSLLEHIEFESFYVYLFINFFFNSLPWLYVGNSIRDHDSLNKLLYYSSWFILVEFLLSFYVFKTINFNLVNYNQEYAYRLLPASLFFIKNLSRKINLVYIFGLFLVLVFIFILGARGPLLISGIFFITIMVKNKRNLINLFVSSFFYIITSFGIFFLITFLIRFNFQSRLIEFTTTVNFFSDENRIKLFNESIKLILKSSLLGYGVGYDRILLTTSMGYELTVSNIIGWYPHNVFLEFTLHFGFILSFFFFAFFISKILKFYVNNSDKNKSDLLLFFIFIGFFPLLISSSYLQYPTFFFLLGYILNLTRNLKRSSI